jgi:acyl-CoA dehydrogenase
MFVMMNAARLAVGVEGYAVAERSLQRALDWARTRVQGRPSKTAAPGATIIEHPDVKRMLLTMKAATEAMRALGLYAALQLDNAAHNTDDTARASAQARADLLIPVVKGWSTELGNEMAALGVQVHGGMGFIEETGAAQYVRDARITTIYEGTTGIQANDLIGRKLGRDKGVAMNALIADMQRELAALGEAGAAALESVGWLRDATQSLLQYMAATPDRALAVSVPYLKLAGFVCGGWLMARSAAQAALKRTGSERDFYEAKIQTARFYAEQILPNALALMRIVQRGAASVTEATAGLI